MTAISLHTIHVQFDNGDVLFDDLTHRFSAGKIGLVGDNGAGKSFLAGLICGCYRPDKGKIERPQAIGFLPQTRRPANLTVAEFLGYDETLKAVACVLSGQFTPNDLLLADMGWRLHETILPRFRQPGLNVEFDRALTSLSGGELSRLMLLALFSNHYDWLILDEPENHLDAPGRAWLAKQIAQYSGNLLLISHDRRLLQLMTETHELSQGTLTRYGGNYLFYQQQKQQQQAALMRRLQQQTDRLDALQREQQHSQQRAERRAKAGKKIRRSGSQSKLILDRMKNSAQAHRASSQRHSERRIAQVKQALSVTQQRLAQEKKFSMSIDAQVKRQHYSVFIDNLVMPYGSQTPLTLLIQPQARCWLQGKNGSGKSTLLKIINEEIVPLSGIVKHHGQIAYLDQHQSLLNNALTVIENMQRYAIGLSERDCRTQLANIGFTHDKITAHVNLLSGGERVKLALLAVVSGQYPASILLLDEPDNHLDLYAREMMEQALASYNGTLIVVSHDRDFIDNIGITMTFSLDEDCVNSGD